MFATMVQSTSLMETHLMMEWSDYTVIMEHPNIPDLFFLRMGLYAKKIKGIFVRKNCKLDVVCNCFLHISIGKILHH